MLLAGVVMSKLVELDCMGMKCPRPIIELAKAARRNSPGTTIHIQADDLAFESDLRAWCETSGSVLVSLVPQGRGVITAQICLGGEDD